MEEQKFNNAVILPEIGPLDFEFGGMAGAEDKIIFPDGNLIPFLPEYETQANVYFDDFGCVTHSFENGGESVVHAVIDSFSAELQKWIKDNFYKNGKCNFSDRDLVVLSGTDSNGNSGNKVLETAQKIGLIPQTLGDFDSFSRDTKLTKQYYYAYARTPEAQPLADEWNKRVNIIGEWVIRSKWEDASKRGALQVYVNAWHEKDGIYYNPTGGHNHAVLMADYKNKKVFDTYKPELKELDSWESAYIWALKINIIEKTMSKPNIQNNSLVVLVEGSGSIGLYLDGRIIIDDVAKIMAVFMARNAKNGQFTGGPVASIKQADWDLFEKRNLKMELI